MAKKKITVNLNTKRGHIPKFRIYRFFKKLRKLKFYSKTRRVRFVPKRILNLKRPKWKKYQIRLLRESFRVSRRKLKIFFFKNEKKILIEKFFKNLILKKKYIRFSTKNKLIPIRKYLKKIKNKNNFKIYIRKIKVKRYFKFKIKNIFKSKKVKFKNFNFLLRKELFNNYKLKILLKKLKNEKQIKHKIKNKLQKNLIKRIIKYSNLKKKKIKLKIKKKKKKTFSFLYYLQKFKKSTIKIKKDTPKNIIIKKYLKFYLNNYHLKLLNNNKIRKTSKKLNTKKKKLIKYIIHKHTQKLKKQSKVKKLILKNIKKKYIKCFKKPQYLKKKKLKNIKNIKVKKLKKKIKIFIKNKFNFFFHRRKYKRVHLNNPFYIKLPPKVRSSKNYWQKRYKKLIGFRLATKLDFNNKIKTGKNWKSFNFKNVLIERYFRLFFRLDYLLFNLGYIKSIHDATFKLNNNYILTLDQNETYLNTSTINAGSLLYINDNNLKLKYFKKRYSKRWSYSPYIIQDAYSQTILVLKDYTKLNKNDIILTNINKSVKLNRLR